MKKLVVFDTGLTATEPIMKAFSTGVINSKTGWLVEYQKLDHFLTEGLAKLKAGRDAVAVFGVLRGTGSIIKKAKQLGIDYFYIDHAYFNPGFQKPLWLRITKNDHAIGTICDVPSDRWKSLFRDQNRVQPWRLNSQRGDRILICPPTNAIEWFMDIDGSWSSEIVGKLKQHLPKATWPKLIVRRKPKEPIVDQSGNLLGFKNYDYENSIEEELKRATCVVAYNSMVALTATRMGIPVIVGPISCCRSVAFSIEAFCSGETPPSFEMEPKRRRDLFRWLAYNQWNFEEIHGGIAWRMLLQPSRQL